VCPPFFLVLIYYPAHSCFSLFCRVIYYPAHFLSLVSEGISPGQRRLAQIRNCIGSGALDQPAKRENGIGSGAPKSVQNKPLAQSGSCARSVLKTSWYIRPAACGGKRPGQIRNWGTAQVHPAPIYALGALYDHTFLVKRSFISARIWAIRSRASASCSTQSSLGGAGGLRSAILTCSPYRWATATDTFC